MPSAELNAVHDGERDVLTGKIQWRLGRVIWPECQSQQWFRIGHLILISTDRTKTSGAWQPDYADHENVITKTNSALDQKLMQSEKSKQWDYTQSNYLMIAQNTFLHERPTDVIYIT